MIIMLVIGGDWPQHRGWLQSECNWVTESGLTKRQHRRIHVILIAMLWRAMCALFTISSPRIAYRIVGISWQFLCSVQI